MPRRYTLSAEDRAKRAEALKRLNADPEFKAAHAERMKRLNADPEFKAANAERASERMKRLHADPEFKVAHAERMKRLNADRRAKGLPVGRPPDPALAALTPEQRKLYQKARACGVSRDEALASVQQTDQE